jgi:ribosomal-protein-alanine N-acetyltransferase
LIVEDDLDPRRVRFTERLRLEPVCRDHADDLVQLHQSRAVAEWHGSVWSREDAVEWATARDDAWRAEGVSKWMAYDRVDSSLVGRGGLSRDVIDGRIILEVGWTVRAELWGRGYATEIGRAGLRFAFDELDARMVVAITEPHNLRSRAVMERLGMTYQHEVTHNDELFALYIVAESDVRSPHGTR